MKSLIVFTLGTLAISVVLVHQAMGQKISPQKGSSYLSYFNEVAQSIPREMTTSQVLTVNVTSALILVMLKALMVSAGYFGQGFHFLGRNANAILNENDLPWAVTFLSSANKDNYQCLYKLACEEPAVAQDYLTGARMLNKLFRTLKWILPYNPKYEVILRGLDDAMITGQKPEMSCQSRYTGCNASLRKH